MFSGVFPSPRIISGIPFLVSRPISIFAMFPISSMVWILRSFSACSTVISPFASLSSVSFIFSYRTVYLFDVF